MNKAELINELSKTSKLTKKDCTSCLNALTEVVSTALGKGENISLTGFGKFEVKNKRARNSYNPYLKKIVKKMRIDLRGCVLPVAANAMRPAA